ncbi:hypothetical protein ES703_37459 [subsurface metagenome]
MELEELMELEGIKLLDSTVFEPPGRFQILRELYDCKTIQEIPYERLLELVNYSRQFTQYFLKDNIFSISEVAKERGVFLSKINNLLEFHSQNLSKPKKNCHIHEGKYERRNKRKYKERQKIYTFTDKDGGKDAISFLNLLGKDTTTLTKLIENKDITAKFSDEEKENYKKFINYFVYVAEKKDLKKDFSKKYRHLKTRNPCNFQTDEKLASAAFTVALTEDVILISSDSDIGRMMRFFYGGEGYKSKFGVRKPNHNIFLYSDFGDGYELQDIHQKNQASGRI